MAKYIKVSCDDCTMSLTCASQMKTEVVMCNFWQSQAADTQKLIRSQFEQLHQMLCQEESDILAAVKQEEEEKITGMKDRMKELSAEVLALAEMVSDIQEHLKEEDMELLMVVLIVYTLLPLFSGIPTLIFCFVFPEF